jgi:hypothetical protein
MRHQTAHKCALALCLLASAEARADPIPWHYSSFPMSFVGQIPADNPKTGAIVLSPVTDGGAGNSYITLSNIAFISDSVLPATFTNATYTLALDITDTKTGVTGRRMFFAGRLDGTLGDGGWLLNNAFTGQTMQSQMIGNHIYTVTIGPFAPPSSNDLAIAYRGSIIALLSVQDAPEPSTLALSGLALSLFGVGWWRRACRGSAARA